MDDLPGSIYSDSRDFHLKHKGKIEIVNKFPIENARDLSLAYTPGVAQPCIDAVNNPESACDTTAAKNTVIVFSDDSSVLGLGDLQGKYGAPMAGMHVMEGKAALFIAFGGVQAFPMCADHSWCNTEEEKIQNLVNTVRTIAPGYGGINLEDIKAPRCFEVERRLKDLHLGVPIFHDDQHGTAIVVTAGMTNAAKVAGKKLSDMSIVINGAGAAGCATARMLINAGVGNIILVDRNGIINKNDAKTMVHVKDDGTGEHQLLAEMTNKTNRFGGLGDALIGADAFVGVSAPGVLKPEMIRTMADKSIIFAMANPTPEILPELAVEAGAFIIATGRSDYPNQVNNVLAFPGIFKGALLARAPEITDEMKLVSVNALAGCVPSSELSTTNILPKPFDDRIYVNAIADAVAECASKKPSIGLKSKGLKDYNNGANGTPNLHLFK
jgi:malate dehydrogenase (oxaloacetate-decarboxylating)